MRLIRGMELGNSKVITEQAADLFQSLAFRLWCVEPYKRDAYWTSANED